MTFPGRGNYPTPAIVRTNKITEVVQYTDPEQFEFFRDWINFCNNNNCNVRFDEQDGTTIRWYYAYSLPLGDWLWDGMYSAREEELRQWLAPLASWPDDLSTLFQPEKQPLLPNIVEQSDGTTIETDGTTGA